MVLPMWEARRVVGYPPHLKKSELAALEMLTRRKVFSISLAGSATLGPDTGTVVLKMPS
ncbi:hypothetical protein OZK63_03390 [Streptomyces sp. UMAF16]|nr:hypothetical protein [Streptomyces sp. UMAF16]